MTLLEFSEIIEAQLIILSRPKHTDENMRWYAHFDYGEVKEGEHGLLSLSGNGSTPNEALSDYATKLQGRKLILHSSIKELRAEYNVPRISGIL